MRYATGQWKQGYPANKNPVRYRDFYLYNKLFYSLPSRRLPNPPEYFLPLSCCRFRIAWSVRQTCWSVWLQPYFSIGHALLQRINLHHRTSVLNAADEFNIEINTCCIGNHTRYQLSEFRRVVILFLLHNHRHGQNQVHHLPQFFQWNLHHQNTRTQFALEFDADAHAFGCTKKRLSERWSYRRVAGGRMEWSSLYMELQNLPFSSPVVVLAVMNKLSPTSNLFTGWNNFLIIHPAVGCHHRRSFASGYHYPSSWMRRFLQWLFRWSSSISTEL